MSSEDPKKNGLEQLEDINEEYLDLIELIRQKLEELGISDEVFIGDVSALNDDNDEQVEEESTTEGEYVSHPFMQCLLALDKEHHTPYNAFRRHWLPIEEMAIGKEWEDDFKKLSQFRCKTVSKMIAMLSAFINKHMSILSNDQKQDFNECLSALRKIYKDWIRH